MKLTVYHDGQFWVGVVEELIDGKVKAIRHIFGVEPQDEQILNFVNKDLLRLLNQSKANVPLTKMPVRKTNPKRIAREAAREVKSKGASTYAQQAIQLEREQRKKIRKGQSKKEKELEKEKKWQLKRQKAKAKHKGH